MWHTFRNAAIRPTALSVAILFVAGCARAQVIPARRVGGPAVSVAAPLATFPIGERLEYQISWWGVSVGTIVLAASLEGNLVKLTCFGRSNPYLEAFYPVRVEITSLVDPEGRSPRRFHALVKRRFRNHESTILFDQKKEQAFHQLPKKRSATVAIGPATQDGLSVLYYVRMRALHVGEKIPLEISADGKNWNLTGEITRTGTVDLKREGRWPAVEGCAQLAYPVPFFQGARAWVWFSADGRRVPLLARIHSRIGPVSVVLTKRS